MKRLVLALLLIGSAAAAQDSDVVKSESKGTSSGTMNTTVNSPPPSAISPQISASNSDLCTVGVAGAVQTQILGISAGRTVRDMNCEKLKNAKTMYDMGMKVAAVSVMCQDERIFDAMMDAGTPCPKDGLIGDAAKTAWEMEANKDTAPEMQRGAIESLIDGQDTKTIGFGAVLGALGLLLLL